MKKTGFVIPWYGDDIPGGAENMFRDLTARLHEKNIPLEILTTCAESFRSDWGRNFYKPGVSVNKYGITVKRFPVRKRDRESFDNVNYKLLNNLPVTYEEEKIFLREMINSNALYRYILEKNNDYGLFVFTPYMFGTTYHGARLFPEKSVIIPCLHDESYARMEHFRKLFPRVGGLVFNSQPEESLAKNLYSLKNKTLTAGIGMDTDISGDADAFREKFRIGKFIIYSGRKDTGKNLDTLIRYHAEYNRRKSKNIKLVLTGGGETISGKNIADLGFVSAQEKLDAMSAGEFLCQPSVNESFSLVIMENWLCKRPVLVNENCPVTKNFVSKSNGGLYFGSYPEFEVCTDFLLNNREISAKMGLNGCEYVRDNFSHETVTGKYIDFFRDISKKQ